MYAVLSKIETAPNITPCMLISYKHISSWRSAELHQAKQSIALKPLLCNNSNIKGEFCQL